MPREAMRELRIRVTDLQYRTMVLVKEADPLHPSLNAQIRAYIDAGIRPYQASVLGVSEKELEG